VFKNEEVMSKVSDVWTKIQGLFNNALTFIKALIQASIIIITAFWDKWGEDIINIATKAWEFITALLKTSFDLINDLLKVFSALFKGDWEGLWEAVETLFINLWENIKDLFKQAVDLIIVTLQTFINMYIQHWTNLWNTVKDFFVKLWDDIKEKFAQGVRDVVASAIQLATDIITALKDLPNKALNIANDLIQGLVNGIKNGASKVVQAAKDMARNVWKSITDVFDMHSPSRLAIRVFQKDFAEEGIGAGILKGIPKVVSDTKKLGNSIMDALDTDIGISTSVAGNGVAKGMRATSATSGNVTYNININNPTVRNDSDIKKISQSIYKTIFASNRAEGVI
jgi:phage-related protein